jgi:cytochrome c556
VAKAKAPEKDEGAKKKKDYLEWAGDMKKAAQELAAAAKAKDPQKVKVAAATLNNACNNCHGVFRD